MKRTSSGHRSTPRAWFRTGARRRDRSDHDCSSLSYRVDSPPSKRNLRDRVLFGIIAATGLRGAEALGIQVNYLALARDDEYLTVRGKGGTQRLHAPGRFALPLAQHPGQRHPGTGGAGRVQNGRPATSARAVPCVLVGRPVSSRRVRCRGAGAARGIAPGCWNRGRRLRGDGASRGQGTAATSANGSALGRSVWPVAAPTAGSPSCS